MQTLKKIWAAIGAASLALGLAACGNDKAEYPSDTIEILVPYSAGGATDTTTRAFAAALEAEMGTSVIVVNREGGATAIGATEAANADADGYHLFVAAGSTFATNPLLQDVSYTMDDFVAIHPLADQPYALVTKPGSGLDTLEDLAASDDRIVYSTFGNGSIAHLAMANTLDEMGVQGEGVPYTSTADAVQAVVSGQIDVAVADMNIAGPQIQAGTLNALAVTGTEAHPSFPDIPSLADTQWPSGAGYISTLAIAAPADTPQEIIDALTEGAEKAYASDSFAEYREKNFIQDSSYMGNTWFTEQMTEIAKRSEADFERLGL